jgi:uncharacterized protein YcbX
MRVRALYIYPVKACRAVAIDDAALGPLGLEHDRRFAFVHPDGRALTQRSEPLLATVRPELDERGLRLDFGGLLQLVIPLQAFAESATVDVWGKAIAAHAAPESLVARAADYLGTRLRLVAVDAAAQRAFVDSQPVLVTTTAMLSGLNEQLALAVGMERFRPNVVIEGAEGSWHRLRAKDAILEYAQPCSRCEVTTIDQASGARRGPEPLRTLSESFEGNFGVYCRVARAGRLRRGEALTAL